jgi:lipoyl(octanoyl) transferase
MHRACTHAPSAAIEWIARDAPIPYAQAVAEMDRHVAAMAAGTASERIWLVEHPPVITAGTTANAADLRDATRFPLVATGRGGRHTYHGPGQRVIYVMLDLGARGRDVRRLVSGLEQWAIRALDQMGVEAFTSPVGTGIWVAGAEGPEKIGAIGIRVRRWISLHGMAINVTTDLAAYEAIIPCGIASHRVTRLADHRAGSTIADLDAALKATCDGLLRALPGPPAEHLRNC